MHQIQIETLDFSVLSELESYFDNNENIDIIQGRNFSGDLTNIELYFRLATDVIAVLTPIITLLIQKKRISSIKIDGNKIELENVSHELAEEALKKHFEMLQSGDGNDVATTNSNSGEDDNE
jgi:hypothetical protein